MANWTSLSRKHLPNEAICHVSGRKPKRCTCQSVCLQDNEQKRSPMLLEHLLSACFFPPNEQHIYPETTELPFNSRLYHWSFKANTSFKKLLESKTLIRYFKYVSNLNILTCFKQTEHSCHTISSGHVYLSRSDIPVTALVWCWTTGININKQRKWGNYSLIVLAVFC